MTPPADDESKKAKKWHEEDHAELKARIIGREIRKASQHGDLGQIKLLIERLARFYPPGHKRFLENIESPETGSDTEVFCNAVKGYGRLGSTPLHYAARIGAHGCVSLLISVGANPRAVNKEGLTALHWAAWNGHLETCRRLLDAGAAVNAQNVFGETPLHLATTMGRSAVVSLLVRAGASPTARNDAGTVVGLRRPQPGQTGQFSTSWTGHCRCSRTPAVGKAQPCNCVRVSQMSTLRGPPARCATAAGPGRTPLDVARTVDLSLIMLGTNYGQPLGALPPSGWRRPCTSAEVFSKTSFL